MCETPVGNVLFPPFPSWTHDWAGCAGGGGLYFLENGRYIPSAQPSPGWTQANQALAPDLMEKSLGEKR